MSRLNLVSGVDDAEIQAIRRRIQGFETVFGHDHLINVLRRLGQSGGRAETLDIIGHSRSPGFLVIGTWTIDDSPQTAASFSELIGPFLVQLGVQIIRILGCSTAASERARNALRRIGYATGCRVLGTKCLIDSSDYAFPGFSRDEALLEPGRCS